jgi:succinate-acetate transporter protein
MFNVQARSITTPNVSLGMALGYGGLVQLIAGIEEWACGNTFGVSEVSVWESGTQWVALGM